MAQKYIQANFEKILEKAINEQFTGSLVFLGPNGGVVRVIFIEGKIKHIDSTWGYGKGELEKLRIWGLGTCLIKALNEKDKETFSKMPDIEYGIEKKEELTRKTILTEMPKTIRILPYMILDSGIESFEEVLGDIQDANLSGFVKIKPSGNILLFYKGRILQGFGGFPPSQKVKNYYILREMMESGGQMAVYSLEKNIAYSIISLFINKTLISGVDARLISIEDLIEDSKISLFNGVVWIDGDLRILIDFEMGEIGEILKIDDVIKSVELPTTLDLKFAKIYKFGKLPEGELLKYGLKIPTKEELEEFINAWNKLMIDIANKVGKKAAQKAFEKVLKESEFSSLITVKDGIFRVISMEKHTYLILEAIIEVTANALSELKTFIGGDWIEEKLKKFYKEGKEIIEILGIEETLRTSWSS